MISDRAGRIGVVRVDEHFNKGESRGGEGSIPPLSLSLEYEWSHLQSFVAGRGRD